MTKTEFQREERYVVFKLSDVADYFYPSEISQLFRLSSTQQVLRERNGKPPLECVVVESDWPEYEPTWKAIEDRVTGAQPAPSFADAYQGAMEEVAIWKKRALEAEELNRKFVTEINGPTYMGEPAQPVPSELVVTPEMEEAFYEKVEVTTVGSIRRLAEGIKAALLAAAPDREAKP